jgi:hypothetical protein
VRSRITALIGLLVLASASAQAQNLVTNPGFETGDFTGWDTTGLGPNASVQSGGLARTGDFAATFGEVAPDLDVLSQVLTTEVGSQYTLSFFLHTPEFNIGSGSPNSFSVFFAGAPVDGPFTVSDTPDYQQFSYTVTASSTSSELRFEISNDSDFTDMDDVSVTPLVVGAPAPEPGALVLLALGGGIAGVLRWVPRRHHRGQR